MKYTINDPLLRTLNRLLLPVALMWSLSSIGGYFLSHTNTEGNSQRYENFFELFRFGGMFGLVQGGGSVGGKSITTTQLVPAPHKIKAILRSPSGSYVVISDGTASQIVGLGEWYKKQFQLIGIGDEVAIFKGFGKSYRLRLYHNDNLVREESVTTFIPDPKAPNAKEWHTVEHAVLVAQLRDIQKVQKSIEVSEVRKGSGIEGFKIDALTQDSIFSTLGVAQGDVIVSVNNQKLGSYADALAIYGKIPHMRSIRITLIRNNQPKDILYEITR